MQYNSMCSRFQGWFVYAQVHELRTLWRALLVIVILGTSGLGDSDEASLRRFYSQHQWFELDNALHGASGTDLHRGAVACAFNDLPTCEKALLVIPQSSGEAYDAHEILEQAYLRTGRYPLALVEAQARLALRPGDRDAEGDIALLRAFPKEQRVTKSHASRVSDQGGRIPVEINRHHGDFEFDTGAVMSFISESEATRMGLRIQDSKARIGNIAGGTAGLKTAVADLLKIGNFELKHVAFMVFRDDQPSFTKIRHSGTIGIPVLLALRTISMHDDVLEFGFPPAKDRLAQANIAFDDSTPVVRVKVLGRELTFVLDTGAQQTFLYQPFVDAFPDLVQQTTTTESKTVTGIGQSLQIESATMPELTIGIGSFEARLQPVRILLKKTAHGSNWFAGNLGMDFLRQAHQITLDFGSRKLVLK